MAMLNNQRVKHILDHVRMVSPRQVGRDLFGRPHLAITQDLSGHAPSDLLLGAFGERYGWVQNALKGADQLLGSPNMFCLSFGNMISVRKDTASWPWGFVKFKHPGIITHPILTFTLDLLWQRLVIGYFLSGQLMTLFNFAMFILAGCYLNNPAMETPVTTTLLLVARLLVYIVGMGRLLWWHTLQMYKAVANNDVWRCRKFLGPIGVGFIIPKYLQRGTERIGLLLTMDMLGMLAFEPLIHCISPDQILQVHCEAWTEPMSFAYGVLLVLGRAKSHRHGSKLGQWRRGF